MLTTGDMGRLPNTLSVRKISSRVDVLTYIRLGNCERESEDVLRRTRKFNWQNQSLT